MVCVGIDVAKDKHDCFIISSEGEALADVFTIPNNAEGFDALYSYVCPSHINKFAVFRRSNKIRRTRIDQTEFESVL